jgi:hypothetical protein
MYERLKIDHHEKIIVYSDSLDVERAVKIKKQCDELDFPCKFYIIYSCIMAFVLNALRLLRHRNVPNQ